MKRSVKILSYSTVQIFANVSLHCVIIKAALLLTVARSLVVVMVACKKHTFAVIISIDLDYSAECSSVLTVIV